MLSVWSIILYTFIPCAIILLSILQFAHGSLSSLNRFAMKFVGTILFSRLGFLPVPLIQALLFIHSIMLIILGTQIYNSTNSKDFLHLKPDLFDRLQAKSFREQRNFYLTCLSFALFWMLYSVYALKIQIERMKEALAGKPSTSSSIQSHNNNTTYITPPSAPIEAKKSK